MSIYKRVSSGLDFLDASVGGLFSNRSYALRGPAGSGRTTACLQFLLAGLENDENVLMLSSDSIENVILKAESIGILLESYLLENRLVLMEYPQEILDGNLKYKNIIHLLGDIEQYIEHYNCSRLAFDTLIPLLGIPQQTQLVNYIYSLMNSIEALNTTTLVTLGEPHSPLAMRISQLIEDSVVGSFSIKREQLHSNTGTKFLIHKMVNQFPNPMSFDIRVDFGVGLTQNLASSETIKRDAQYSTNRDIPIDELPLKIALIDRDEMCLSELEDTFSPTARFILIESKENFEAMLPLLDCDVLVINASNPNIDWKGKVAAVKNLYPQMPVFIIAERITQQVSYKIIKLVGADALFIKPVDTTEFIKATKAIFNKLDIMDDIYEKYGMSSMTNELPDDLVPTSINGTQQKTSDEVNLIPIQLFKEKIQLKILKSTGKSEFSLVSFKIVYTLDVSSQTNLPQGLELIKKVASIVTHGLRGVDDVATRHMDRIVVSLEDTNREGANAYVKRVIKDLKSELQNKLGLQLDKHISILVAFAMFPTDGDNVKDLMSEVTEKTRNLTRISA